MEKKDNFCFCGNCPAKTKEPIKQTKNFYQNNFFYNFFAHVDKLS